MGETVIARNGLREHGSVLDGFPLEEFLGAFVSVEMSQLEMQNCVPHYAESEMSRLDDARMNGAHSDFRDTFALHLQEAVLAL
jgi:hypothetical protein